ncbi:iron-containing alcohol dehydrogenase [Paenibacillus sp. MMS18-CY102]|uniref:iron-containing alcohol dehydrogenase n=1 Tax=Paenibacillus sp. MMS18-CY102 TaxID=2682849 RepID=UPI0013653944|nr:iron-containing alcohol dehydrogenase [Paenibacillus sp. MMS18-CY102]MWC26484.1 iron-containing alcohol dehydrogenase [Paenibacillus sp. MMS18-CY102]
MKPFAYHNPTRLYFGEGSLQHLSGEAVKYGKSVLLVYGGGSIKRNGLYEEVLRLLGQAGTKVTELAGVEPNPRLSTVHRGAELIRENGIDWVLAVGGGSTLDCAKAIVAAAKYEGSFWDIVTRKAAVESALPLGTILTLAATGSEMNANSVITNEETLEKHGWASPHVYPAFSILEPLYTASAPKDHTVYGMVDMMAHVFEQYFHHDNQTPVQDGFSESILRAVVEAAPKLVNDLTNVQLRETILYSGTMALNGTLSMGIVGDWANHDMEHAISAVYDIPHGGGLAILFPNWMTYVLDDNVARFRQFAVNVFGIQEDGHSDREIAEAGIAALREFWNSIGAPSRLADYGIDDSRLEEMAEKAVGDGTRGNFRKLTKQDVVDIYRLSL